MDTVIVHGSIYDRDPEQRRNQRKWCVQSDPNGQRQRFLRLRVPGPERSFVVRVVEVVLATVAMVLRPVKGPETLLVFAEAVQNELVSNPLEEVTVQEPDQNLSNPPKPDHVYSLRYRLGKGNRPSDAFKLVSKTTPIKAPELMRKTRHIPAPHEAVLEFERVAGRHFVRFSVTFPPL